MASSIDTLWMRVAVAGKIHTTQAVRDLLHSFGLPKDGKKLFVILENFKINATRKLKRKIREDQWDQICHDCNNQCPANCLKKGVSDLNDFDITILVILYRSIKHIIPTITPQLLKLKAQLKPFVEQACYDRNSLMHFPKNMTQIEFDDAWNRTESCLNGMRYANMRDFNKMKTCLLDEYYKQQIDCLSDRCDHLKATKGDAVDVKINEKNIKG